MENFNKKEFVKNYKLTKDEYLLLPLSERMAYSQQQLGYMIKQVPKVGDRESFKGILEPHFKEFFTNNGCVVSYYNFGVTATDIKRIDRGKYRLKPKDYEDLQQHCDLIAEYKAYVYEESIKRHLELLDGDPLSTHISSSFLENLLNLVVTSSFDDAFTEEEIDLIVSAELDSLKTQVEANDNVYVDPELSPFYQSRIKSLGYRLTSNDKERITITK